MQSSYFRAAVAALALSLSACGGSDGSAPTPAPTPVPTPTPTPATHTLSFDANGATGTAPPQMTYTVGQTLQLPKSDLVVAGYTFSGWNLKADGSDTNFSPESAVVMGDSDAVLYAQFKAPPIKVTQQGGDGESRLLVEWPDGSQQDIVYTSEIVGWGNRYDFNPIVGGLAALVPGGTRYIHTCYPTDYSADGQPVMTITSGGSTLLKATSFRRSDREGVLAASSSTVTADEIKITITGHIVDVDADTEVELIIRSNAPRMALTRSKITYTKSISVVRLYHQLVHANPTRFTNPVNYLSVNDGHMIEVSDLPENLSAGLFYEFGTNYYVGFVGPREGYKDFLAYRDGPYFAAYKIVYDNALKKPGDFTESRGVAAWGYAIPDARKLLGWSAGFARGTPPQTVNVPYEDRGALNMVGESYLTSFNSSATTIE